MTDWAASGRVDDFRCELVDPFTLKAVGEVDFVPTASSVTYDYESTNVVGATMALNPHGDMAIYDTLVRLTRGNESLLYPFIDSKGSFGKKYSRDMAPAAPRYSPQV